MKPNMCKMKSSSYKQPVDIMRAEQAHEQYKLALLHDQGQEKLGLPNVSFCCTPILIGYHNYYVILSPNVKKEEIS